MPDAPSHVGHVSSVDHEDVDAAHARRAEVFEHAHRLHLAGHDDHGGSPAPVHGHTVVLVPAGAQAVGVLEDLRSAGVRRVDLLVVDGGNVAAMVRSVRHRWPVGRVIDGRDTDPVRVRVGTLTVDIAPPEPPAVVASPP